MDSKNIAKAVGIGMAAGAALSMMATPRKKSKVMKKSNMSKAIRAMGDILEDVETALGW